MVPEDHAADRDEFLGLRPDRSGAPENVDGARFRIARQVGEMFTDGDGVADHGHGVAKLLVGGGIAGRQFLLLGPGCAAADEDIGRPGVGQGRVVIEGADDDRVAAYRHGVAELVGHRAVTGQQDRLLRPGRAAPDINKCRARLGGGRAVIACADHHRVAVESHRVAELGADATRRAGDFLSLREVGHRRQRQDQKSEQHARGSQAGGLGSPPQPARESGHGPDRAGRPVER